MNTDRPLGIRFARPARFAAAGVTLFEILLVLVILAVLAVLFLGNLDVLARSRDLTESVTRIKAVLAMCRAQAMATSQQFRIRIHADGSMTLVQQGDPVRAPHMFTLVNDDWARMRFLVEDVWVDSILPLPSGPPPIRVENDELDLDAFDDHQSIPVTELEQPFELLFEPDGSSTSVRLFLRDSSGRGVQLTLDGRVGRVELEELEIELEDLERPEPLPDEDKIADLYTSEQVKEFLETPRQ